MKKHKIRFEEKQINKRLYLDKELKRAVGRIQDPLLAKMIKLLMRQGNRSKAEKTLNKTYNIIEEKYPGQGLKIIYLGINEAKREVGLRVIKHRSKKKSIYYVPFIVSPIRGLNEGIKAIFKESKKGSAFFPIWENLAEEIIKASLGIGKVVSEKYKINKIALRYKYRSHFGRHFQ